MKNHISTVMVILLFVMNSINGEEVKYSLNNEDLGVISIFLKIPDLASKKTGSITLCNGELNGDFPIKITKGLYFYYLETDEITYMFSVKMSDLLDLGLSKEDFIKSANDNKKFSEAVKGNKLQVAEVGIASRKIVGKPDEKKPKIEILDH